MAIIFASGDQGEWAIRSITPVAGATLPAAARLRIHSDVEAETDWSPQPVWSLRGAISHLRYTTGTERTALNQVSVAPGAVEARCGALIPISKSPAWWALAQDERLAIYQRSNHTAIGMDYLPGIRRRLHHGRDLGEPFDFLTWFDFAPDQEAAFDALLVRLRATEEWSYVNHEVDVRVSRDG